MFVSFQEPPFMSESILGGPEIYSVANSALIAGPYGKSTSKIWAVKLDCCGAFACL